MTSTSPELAATFSIPPDHQADMELARKYAALCDVFVMDAFGTAHRAQASTHGAGKFAPVACAGLLLSEGIIEDATDLAALDHSHRDPDGNTVVARFSAGVEAHSAALERIATGEASP